MRRTEPSIGRGVISIVAASHFLWVFAGLAILPRVSQSLGTQDSNWVKQFPPDGAWDVRDVCMLDSANAWVVGMGGSQVMRTHDAGWTWESIDVGSVGGFEKVLFVDELHGWILGQDIHRTSDGGLSWRQAWDGAELPMCMASVGTETLWVVGIDSLVISTFDGGYSWESHNFVGSRNVWSVFFLNKAIGWISATNLFLGTTDGGVTWDSLSAIQATSLQFLNPQEGWATVEDMVLRTHNGGRTWTQVSSIGFERSITDFFSSDSLNGWCTVWDHPTDPPPGYRRISMMKTTNGGASWSSQPVTDPLLFGVSFSGRCAMAVGGSVLTSTDGGESWWYRAGTFGETISAIEMLDSLHGWVAGGNRSVFRTNDGGNNWVPQLPPGVNDLWDVCFVDTNRGWAVGEDIGVLRTLDGGRTWLTANPARLIRVQFADAARGYGISRLNPLMSSDSGASWWGEFNPPGLLADMTFPDSLHGWIVAPPRYIAATLNGGRDWETINTLTLGDSLRAIFFVDSIVGWVASNRIFKTTSGGQVWMEQSSGSYGWIRALNFFDRQTGWAVGDNGLVLGTTDGGDHWLRLPSPIPSPNPILGIDAVSNHTIWVVGNRGQVYLSQNGGGLTDVQQYGRQLPTEYFLEPNYPNPFNSQTTFEFRVPHADWIALRVYDILGREVVTLANGNRHPGMHRVSWDASGVSSGTYLVRLITPRSTQTRKVLLIR